MYISEIVLENFKSFKNRTKISFCNDFIVISGPNGSGKSNVVDGILFALGLSNSRAMRAERLTDLIYSGQNGKKPSHAEVSLRFSDGNGNATVIKRRIKETEKGYYSYYYMDGRQCSLNEIHEYLSEQNIFPQGYNVIMQGDVTRFLEMTPVERRKIIDDIAGVSEFDEKKEKAFSELETVKNRIERINIILEELDFQMEKLEGERDIAIRYLDLKKKKKRFEDLFLLAKLEKERKELKKREKKIKDMEREKDEISRALSEKKSDLRKLDDEIENINQEIFKKTGEERIKIKKEMEEIVGLKYNIRNFIEVAEKEILNGKREKERIFTEIINLQERKKEKNEELNRIKKEKENIVKEIEKRKREYEEINKKIEEVDKGKKIFKLREILEKEKDRRNELLRDKDRIFYEIKRKSEEIEEAKRKIENVREVLTKLGEERENLKKELEKIKKERESISDDVSDLEKRKDRIKIEIIEKEEKLRKLQREYAIIDGRIKAAEEMGRYSHGVSAILEGKKRGEIHGIYGTIAELGRVNPEYSTALEAAAGSRMEYLVADSDEDAYFAIKYLKEKDAGRATFLPLNRIVPRNPGEKPEIKGVIDYAINLITYDKKFHPAFSYVFGDTLVVDRIETAMKLINKFRIVTLDGDLIEKSGVMTGGSKRRSRFRFMVKEGEKLTAISEEMAILESKRKTLLNGMEIIEKHIDSLKKEISSIELQINEKEMKLDRIEEDIGNKREIKDYMEKKMEKLVEEKRTVEKELEIIEKEILEREETISNCKMEMEKIKVSGLDKIEENAKKLIFEIKDMEKKIALYEGDIKGVILEIEYINSRIDELKERILKIEEKKKKLTIEISEKRREMDNIEKELEEKRKKEEKLLEDVSDLRKKRDEKMRLVSLVSEEKEKFLRKYDGLTGSVLLLERERKEILRKIEEMEEKIKERRIESHSCLFDPDEVKKELSKIEKEMCSLEPINMRAIEEYERVLERERQLKEKRDILSREREEIISRIKKYEQMKKDVFMEAFKGINSNFSRIFGELSGGYAELVLENPEDPFSGGMTIRARLAGKSFQRLDAMSGGEKSLTALSFLFAIGQYKPAPFYALDEIDMFLDGVNVEKVANMIKKLKKNAQFIVVSLREQMIGAADTLLGVVMQNENYSTITGVKLNGV
ncbi:MAG: chromosome segregation protein SMC [Candidatus Syntropharchaeia archaeon]